MNVRTKDNPGLGRYEVFADDELVGFADYRLRDDRISFTHTEVDRPYQGRGVAGTLVRDALDSARDSGLSVLPFCSYVSAYIERHPDYLPLVPEAERSRFGLA